MPAPAYDSTNLQELIKRRNEQSSKIDSLNNARKQKEGL